MQEYEITLPDGIPTTVLLTDEDAERRGLEPAKTESPANKEAKAPANKARTAGSNKRAEAAAQAFGAK